MMAKTICLRPSFQHFMTRSLSRCQRQPIHTSRTNPSWNPKRLRSLAQARSFSQTTSDPIALQGFDHLEFYCGNARQSAHWFQTVFGFKPVAYSGLETGRNDKTSYVLEQNNIRFVFSSSLEDSGAIANHVKKHSDGVRFLSFEVPDSQSAFHETVKRGAKPYMEPQQLEDKRGKVMISGVHAYGDTVHLLVERKEYQGPFLPGYEPWQNRVQSKPTGLKRIDHVVANVGWGEMETWAKYYHNIFEMEDLISFDDKDISTKYTALMSKVVTNSRHTIKLPINEPAQGLKKSQIEEFLNFYKSPGIQHIALETDDIISTVEAIKNNGCDFLVVPDSYYDTLESRVGKLDENINELKRLNILVDKDVNGYMLQIFTKPLSDRPTWFIEIIQRKGSQSFGKGNFKALFEAIEAEQFKRGTI